MHPIVLALASIAISVAAQFALKAGMSAPGVKTAIAEGGGWRLVMAVALQPQVLAGLLLYALGAVVWLAVLTRWEVSKAYPLVGLGFVLTLAVGLMLGEAVTWQRGVGVLLITAGVVVVART